MIFNGLFWWKQFTLIKNSCKERKKKLIFFFWFLWINLSNQAKKCPKSSWQHFDSSVMFTTENEIIRSSWRQIYVLMYPDFDFLICGESELNQNCSRIFVKKIINVQLRKLQGLNCILLTFINNYCFYRAPQNWLYTSLTISNMTSLFSQLMSKLPCLHHICVDLPFMLPGGMNVDAKGNTIS